MKQHMKRIVITWLVCVLALAALSVWVGIEMPWAKHGRGAGGGLIKPAFTLVNPKGETVTEAAFKKKYMLIFFGFTHCPDICPTALLLMQNAISQLDAKLAANVQPIFITVDPERDTPKVVGTYVAHFGKGVVGLTGTPEQVKQTADNFKVFYSKVPMSDPAMGYMVNHSGFIYLIGPGGEYLTHQTHDVSEAALAKTLREYVH